MTITTPAVPTRRRWAGLAVLSASVLLVVMDMTVLNVALPAISADLRPESIELLWMVDAYALVLSGLLVTVSALGDRWGRKRMLMTGFAVFGLASTTVLAADSPLEVIAVRALLGVGGAMIMPSTLSMIRNLFTDPAERAKALGVWSAMAAVGAALGPLVAGVLLEHFSWHAAFLVNVPVMVLAIAFGLFLLPESKNPRPGRWDALATLLSMAGMVALVYAIKNFGKYGLTSPGALVASVVAVVALGWFAVRCLRRPDPLLELRLFRSAPFSAGVVTALITSIAMASVLLLLAQWMQLVQGYGPLEAGVRLLPAALAAVIASPLAPSLAARIGARTVLAGGLALTGVAFLLLFVVPGPLGYWTVAVALTLVGLGNGSLAIASATIMSGSPPAKSGSAAAIEETSYELGGALGVAVLGSVAAAAYRSEVTYSGPGAGVVRESLGGALDVAKELGAAGGRLAEQATAAFTNSLTLTSGVAALLLAVGALVVWWLTPRHLDLSAADHH
ncbi:Antiseptic resistance protein [[Actinomadura] parvosata subsp. kistnae]|uniref:MFS transporter n=1 Tax=[Actinomadura] parvosata subsp. kistnae TaxID=1909395 RepID=A0A1U9ZRL5_9ACTN|nr:MFS transporter [Nonomuraea sp. ATCC 55076]AQZ60585.1 MFS transporter [Nonomuraea sp. ATCC 55076]SPL90839.1 Antiseptic resistance protein [Actinomadura parvosata subsp. kistnae]